MGPIAEPGTPSVTFTEHGQRATTRMVGFSHLSIEVGHVYMEDFLDHQDLVRAQFRQVAAWAAAAESMAVSGPKKPRVSTCFLIDDYFRHDTDPASVLAVLLPLAEEAGLRIDYLAREAGCAVSGDVKLAELVAARLLSEPPPGANGSQPPAEESGRLRHGDGFQAFGQQAMQPRARRTAATHGSSRRGNSVSLDVELWHDSEEALNGGGSVTRRTWSCPFLASVWQLLRLGLVRNHGEPVASPVLWKPDAPWPSRWDEVPTVVQLNPDAKPFTAYRSISVVPQSYMSVEDAVRLIVGRYTVEPEVRAATETLAGKDGITLPRSVSDRITHVFVEGR